MKVGELAKITGITIRTLHHYHQIGLLIPSHLTESGHRLYGENDLKKLYHILALKDFGFSLEEILDILSVVDASPKALVKLQIQKTESKLRELEKLHGQLLELQNTLIVEQNSTVDKFIEVIQMMQMNSKKYLTKEQIEELRGSFDSIPKDEMEQMEEEWFSFIALLKHCYKTKKPADSTEMRQCIEFWERFNTTILGQNDEIRNAVYQYHSEERDSVLNYGLSPELYNYLSENMESKS